MPWFWSSATKDDDSEEDSSEYNSEDYTSEEEDEEEIEEAQPPSITPSPDSKNDIKDKKDSFLSDAAVNNDGMDPTKDKDDGDDDMETFVDVAVGDDVETATVDNTREPEMVPIEFVKTSKEGRARLDSGLTFGDEKEEDKGEFMLPDTDSDNSIGEELDEKGSGFEVGEAITEKGTEKEGNDDGEKQEEEEGATSATEKQSLLVLAAEHDRVDILQAILNDETNDDQTLLNGNDNSTIPPLHIAVSYGSVNATNCLLRMGADPSVRPIVQKVLEIAKQSETSTPSIAHLERYDDATAWELVFGANGESHDEKPAGRKRTIIKPFNISLSKREGIRHAFTAEALRCIGSDEVDRLRQLLQSGMPHCIEIGGKQLYDWCVEMGALQCEELLRPTQVKDNAASDDPATSDQTAKKKTAVLDRGERQSIPSLLNRLDESEALANALSSCLDTIGEEVAVCSGLLLMGSGASALASHVRSLRTSRENKADELERLQEAWSNSEDELAYWIKECGSEGDQIANQVFIPKTARHQEEPSYQQLIAQIAACENKIRMLRVSIEDLSEENTRNLAEVERRGLSGGITLVRGLREEIRDLEFQISQAKSGDAECRMKINLLQDSVNAKSRVQEGRQTAEKVTRESETVLKENGLDNKNSDRTTEDTSIKNGESSCEVDIVARVDSRDAIQSEAVKSSEKITTGQSTAIVLRPPGDQGYFPISLWHIILRIIGLREDPYSRRNTNRQSTPAVII